MGHLYEQGPVDPTSVDECDKTMQDCQQVPRSWDLDGFAGPLKAFFASLALARPDFDRDSPACRSIWRFPQHVGPVHAISVHQLGHQLTGHWKKDRAENTRNASLTLL